jgi:pterin-4a-carbinolamine dehydratase
MNRALSCFKRGFMSCSNISSCTMSMKNYIINYPQYMKDKDSYLEEKWNRHNEEYKEDLRAIRDTEKEYALRKWSTFKDEHSNTSALMREFTFKENQHMLQFVNQIKNKCDELDHHPEWAMGVDNILKVRLTSHFRKNNISERDYQLAAHMSSIYEKNSDNSFLFNRRNQLIFSYSFSAAVFIFISYLIYVWYKTSKNYNITSRDFFFARVNTHDNDYIGLTKLKK